MLTNHQLKRTNLSEGQAAALKLQGYSVKQHQNQMFLYFDTVQIAIFHASQRKWNVFYEPSCQGHTDKINYILGPDSAY